MKKPKKEKVCKHKLALGWNNVPYCFFCGLEFPEEPTIKGKPYYGDFKCPNGYEGENMVCCRCVRPMYPKPIKGKETAEETFFEELDYRVSTPDDMIETLRTVLRITLKDYKRELISDLKKKLPKKQFIGGVVHNNAPDEWHDRGLVSGFNQAIDKINSLLADLSAE